MAGCKQLIKDIENFDKSVKKEIAIEIRNNTRRRFTEQTENWKPLKEATIKRKTKGTKDKILVGRTRKLSQSIRYRAYKAGRIEIGTNVVYARIHNEGGVIRGHIKMPKREFLKFGKEEIAIIDKIIKANF